MKLENDMNGAKNTPSQFSSNNINLTFLVNGNTDFIKFLT